MSQFGDKRQLALGLSRDRDPLRQIWLHIWNSHTHVAYSLWYFEKATITAKECSLLRVLMLKRKSRRKNSKSKKVHFSGSFSNPLERPVDGFRWKLRTTPSWARPSSWYIRDPWALRPLDGDSLNKKRNKKNRGKLELGCPNGTVWNTAPTGEMLLVDRNVNWQCSL